MAQSGKENKIMRREWTEQEIIYLNRRYLKQPVSRTAAFLNRTESSVKRKASRIGLNHYADNLTAKSIARCFHTDVSVVIRWINKLGLPAYCINCTTETRFIIEADKFWKWAEDHKDKINWAGYELKSILPEPEWVNEIVRAYPKKRSRKKITEHEKNQIRNMLRKGMSYKEISEQIGRSYYSVNHICRTIYERKDVK